MSSVIGLDDVLACPLRGNEGSIRRSDELFG
jgi:hypothetical protein